MRTGVWRGFGNRPRTLETAEKGENPEKGHFFLSSAPNPGMHQILVQMRSDAFDALNKRSGALGKVT